MQKRFSIFMLTLTLVVAAFACAACADNREKLPVPQSVAEHEGILDWDAVDNADEYIVSINGMQYRTETNSYPLFELEEEKEYILKVKAISGGDYADSPFSSALNYTGKKNHAAAIDAVTVSGIDTARIKVTAPLGEEYEYSLNAAAWQDAPVFGGLTEGKMYKVYARIKGDDVFFPSEPVQSRGVTTIGNESIFISIGNAITGLNIKGYGYELLVIPDKLNGAVITSVNMQAFAHNSAIKAVYFAASTVRVGEGAFEGCSNLVEVDLRNVSAIDARAFLFCESLTDIDLSKVSSVGDSAFMFCQSLTSVNLEQATFIGKESFRHLTTLTTVMLGENITDIGESAFSDCHALYSIDLSKVVSIGAYAFFYCVRLTEVDLSEADTIGMYAFYSCVKLADVKLKADSQIEYNAFGNCPLLS